VEGSELLCLYAVEDGYSERSFALQVAQVAGVPADSMFATHSGIAGVGTTTG
jgi:DNA mismatch repair ATPase MutS